MRKRCNRKHYATYGFDAVAHAIAGAAITDKKSLDQLKLRDLSSLDAILTGNGGIQEWSDLTTSMNICEIMAKHGVGPEALEDCVLAQQELLSAAKRYEKSGVMGLTGNGIKAIRNMLEYHDLQRQSIQRSDYEKYIDITLKRIKSKAPEVEEV